MSKISLSLSFLFIFAVAFKNPKLPSTIFGNKSWPKGWAKLPSGSWIQKTEVTNGDFLQFLEELKDSGKTESYHAFYPDTLGWAKGQPGSKPYVSYYFTYPGFSNYPLVNITYDAALAYCNWLNLKYEQLDKKPFGNVAFRLPTHKEWMEAASSGKKDGRTYPWNGLYLKNNRGQRLCNYRHESDSAFAQNAGEKNAKLQELKGFTTISSPVNSFFPNDLGLYNVSGNVAEMVSEFGIAAGGSYLDYGYQVRIQSTKTYTISAPDIGFRVLMYEKP